MQLKELKSLAWKDIDERWFNDLINKKEEKLLHNIERSNSANTPTATDTTSSSTSSGNGNSNQTTMDVDNVNVINVVDDDDDDNDDDDDDDDDDDNLDKTIIYDHNCDVPNKAEK